MLVAISILSRLLFLLGCTLHGPFTDSMGIASFVDGSEMADASRCRLSINLDIMETEMLKTISCLDLNIGETRNTNLLENVDNDPLNKGCQS